MGIDQHGYVTPGATRSLLADLSPPLYYGSEIAVELLQLRPELWASNPRFQWRWDVKCGSIEAMTVTNAERFSYRVPSDSSASKLEITCTLMNNGADTNISIKGEYSCVAGLYPTFWEGSPPERAIVELIHDFKTYIEDAARRTGPNGVSARFIAAILFIEIWNRPKVDRQREVEEVGHEIAELSYERHRRNFTDFFNANLFLHKSFGAGQIKMSTLAMATGMIPLVEHARDNNTTTVKQIEESFMMLSTDQMWTLWRLIRWPKSNIDAAAKILQSLKNRPSRYPNLSRADFLANRRAMEIIATEYNLGATSTPEPEAGSSDYGELAASICLDPATNSLIHSHFTHT